MVADITEGELDREFQHQQLQEIHESLSLVNLRYEDLQPNHRSPTLPHRLLGPPNLSRPSLLNDP